MKLYSTLEFDIVGAPRDPNSLGDLLSTFHQQLLMNFGVDIPLWFLPPSCPEETVHLGILFAVDDRAAFLAEVGSRLEALLSKPALNAPSFGATWQDASILSHISFEPSTFVAEKLLAGFLAGTRVTLAALSDNKLFTADSDRFALVTQLVSRCFDALDLSAEQRVHYARYHSDRILRFLVLRAGKDQQKACDVLALLEERAKIVSGLVCPRLSYSSENPALIEQYASCWLHAVVEVCSAADERLPLAWSPDPFAKGPSNIILFQLIHIVARQLGLSLLEEAQALTVVRYRLGHAAIGITRAFELTRPPLENESAQAEKNRTCANIQSPWMILVEAGGDQGKILIDEFKAKLGTAYKACVEALATLRQHNLGPPRLELAREKLRLVSPHVELGGVLAHLLGRFFWGTEAYYHYCLGNLAQAECILDRAGEHLRHAIDTERGLIPCAPLNSDIPLQRARIAHRQGNWARTIEELSLLADLESGRLPLQKCSDGLSVTYPLIETMCCTGLSMRGSDGQAVREYLDEAYRIRSSTDGFVVSILRREPP